MTDLLLSERKVELKSTFGAVVIMFRDEYYASEFAHALLKDEAFGGLESAYVSEIPLVNLGDIHAIISHDIRVISREIHITLKGCEGTLVLTYNVPRTAIDAAPHLTKHMNAIEHYHRKNE